MPGQPAGTIAAGLGINSRAHNSAGMLYRPPTQRSRSAAKRLPAPVIPRPLVRVTVVLLLTGHSEDGTEVIRYS